MYVRYVHIVMSGGDVYVMKGPAGESGARGEGDERKETSSS